MRDYLTSVSQNTLLKQQDSVDLRDLRRELLTSALDYYKEFVRQQGGDPQLRRELAEAHYRLGEIAAEIGTVGESIAAFEAARSVWKELQAAAPDDPSIRAHLAECQLAIGSRLLSDDQFKAARSALESARDVLLPLIRLYPDVADYQLDLAQCYHLLGRIQSELGSPDQGLEPLERGTSLLKAWLARDPGDARFQRKLADIINVRGFVNHKRRDYEAAIADFREVERICAVLLAGVTSGPRPIHLLERLALAHYNIATILMEFERPTEALEELGRSLAYREALATAHPSVFTYQLDLGTNLGEIAALQHRAKQDGKALVTIERSIDVLEKLVGSRPEDTRFRAALGRSWNILGFIRDEARDNLQALPAFEHAVKEATRSMEEAPEVDQYRFNAIYTLDNLAEQFVDLGRPAEGFPLYRRAIALRQVRLDARPGDRDLTLDLAKGLWTLGTILRHAGESPEARQALARAREVLAPVADAAPADAALQAQLGAILDGEALILADEGRTAEAIPILRARRRDPEAGRRRLPRGGPGPGMAHRIPLGPRPAPPGRGGRRGSGPARRGTPGPLEGPPPRPGRPGPPGDPPGRPDRLRQDAHRRTRPVGPRPRSRPGRRSSPDGRLARLPRPRLAPCRSRLLAPPQPGRSPDRHRRPRIPRIALRSSTALTSVGRGSGQLRPISAPVVPARELVLDLTSSRPRRPLRSDFPSGPDIPS